MLLTYHLSSKALFCGRAKPRQTAVLRPGRTFLQGRNLCGGFRPFFLWESEARAAIVVRRTQRDPADRADRHDQLLATVVALHRQGEKAVPGLARERLQCEPLAASEFHLDMGAVGAVRR